MDYLSQLPHEILQLILVDFSAQQLYNNRTINRLFYALYNSQYFWKLKFQYDHGFIIKIIAIFIIIISHCQTGR